jgi:RimJ/RimL family protein N-acetyltransferase
VVLCCTAVADLTDGLIVLRPPAPEDRDALLGLRDEQFHRFMGPGSPEPQPTFCIWFDGAVIGWVDADEPGLHAWLTDDELNLGYALHPDHRGRGYATRAVMLLLHHLSQASPASTATLAIDLDNAWSVAIAERCGFEPHGTVTGDKESWFFKKPIPPTTYTDGVVTIRPFEASDFDRDMEAKDEEQQRWLWLPEHREHWAAMTPAERVAHNQQWFVQHGEDERTGPKWTFTIDVGGQYVGYVDCDLANDGVPHGEANISYSSHPAERGKGYVSRGVRLILRFLGEHTGARTASIGVDERNEASLRVARAVGAVEVSRHIDKVGDPMVRHELPISR